MAASVPGKTARSRAGRGNDMKRVMCILLALCLLAGMTGAMADGPREGKPWPNPELPGNLPDHRPAAEEDYYLYVNFDRYGQADTTLDVGRSIAMKVRENLRSAVEKGETADAKALGILIGLLEDGARREREGMEPLMSRVRRVRETKSLEELSALCREDGFLIGYPFASYVILQGGKAPDKFILTLQISVHVPNEEVEDECDEVLLDKQRTEERLVRLGYDAETAHKLTERLVSYQEGGKDIEGDSFEEDQRCLTAAEIRSIWPLLYDQMAGHGMFDGVAEDAAVFQTSDMSAFRAANRECREENLDLIQAVVCLGMFEYAWDYLDPDTYAWAHRLDNAPNLKDAAWDYLRNTARYLAEQVYAYGCLPEGMREKVIALSEEYRQALEDRMRHRSWLSEASRQEAAKKAEELRVITLGSQKRVDYAPLLEKLSAGDPSLLEAAAMYDRTDRQRLMAMAGTPYVRGDRSQFSDSLLDTNAVYHPDHNTVYVMAGVLLDDFYNDSSRETLLGTIGQTLGHEIGHSFDSYSYKYNWNGKMNDENGTMLCPLTQEDQQEFQEKVMRVLSQLNSIEVADGVNINGQRVINEALADLTGLRLTLDLIEKEEHFDRDLFFRTLAGKYFRGFTNREDALSSYSTDYHPAHYTRVNFIFRQFDAFYQVYPSIVEGTAMYLKPEERETVW